MWPFKKENKNVQSPTGPFGFPVFDAANLITTIIELGSEHAVLTVSQELEITAKVLCSEYREIREEYVIENGKNKLVKITKVPNALYHMVVCINVDPTLSAYDWNVSKVPESKK